MSSAKRRAAFDAPPSWKVQPENIAAPSGVVAVTIAPSGQGRGATVVPVVVADTDVPDTAPVTGLEQMLTSLRAIG